MSIEHSEDIKDLAKALAAFQGEIGVVEASAKNPFIGNMYVPLPKLIDHVKPVMAKHGLSIVQIPSSPAETHVLTDEKGAKTYVSYIALTTMLMHSSGQWIKGTITLPFGKQKGLSLAQAAGAVITYLRRYALSSALRVASDEDLDGYENPEKVGGTVGDSTKKSELSASGSSRAEIVSRIVELYKQPTFTDSDRAALKGLISGLKSNEELIKFFNQSQDFHEARMASKVLGEDQPAEPLLQKPDQEELF